MKQTTKFLHIVMCMVLGLSVSMTSCKDYDDDIDGLNQRVDALESSLDQLSKDFGSLAYVKSVSFANGKLTVTPSTGTPMEYTIPDEDTNTTYSIEAKPDGKGNIVVTIKGNDGTSSEASFSLPTNFDANLLTIDSENGRILYDGTPTGVTIPAGFVASKLTIDAETGAILYDGEPTGVTLPKDESFDNSKLTYDSETGNILYDGKATGATIPLTEAFNPDLLSIDKDNNLCYGDKVLAKLDVFDPERLILGGENGLDILYGNQPTGISIPKAPTLTILEIKDSAGSVIGYSLKYGDNDPINLKIESGRLQGLVFIPDLYYQGIEALAVNTYDYKALENLMNADANGYADATKYPKGYVEPTLGEMMSITPKLVAKYHLNPSNVSDTYLPKENMSFITEEKLYTKGGGIVMPEILERNVQNGILSVSARLSEGMIKDIATDNFVTVMALQVGTRGENGVDTLITSDYAALKAVKATNFVLSNAKEENTVCQHLYKTLADAIAGEPLYNLPYNDADGIDVAELVRTHADREILTQSGTQHSRLDMNAASGELQEYGFEYEYALIGYTDGVNKTSQSAHAAMQGSMLRAQTVKADGTQAAWGADQSRSTIGRKPIVRILLKDVISQEYVAVGYAKFEIVGDEIKDGILHEVTYPFTDVYTSNCTPAEYKFTLDWNEVETGIYTALDMSKEEFETEFELDGFIGTNTPVTPATQFDKVDEAATALVDPIGKVVRTTADIAGSQTQVLEWTISNAEAYELFVNDDPKNTSIAAIVRFVRHNANNTSSYVYVTFTWTPSALNINPTGAIDNKFESLWFAHNSAEKGDAEVHFNVRVPEFNTETATSCTFQNDLFSVFEGRVVKIVGDDEKLYSSYTDATLTEREFKLITPSVTKITGMSGKTYSLKVNALGTELIATELDKDGNETTNVGVVVRLNANQTPNPTTAILIYQENDIAKDVLNYADHTALGDAQTLTARVEYTAVNGCDREIGLKNGTFDVKFLRPLSIYPKDNDGLQDAVDGGDMIKIADILNISDWRYPNSSNIGLFTQTTNYYFKYYGVESIDIPEDEVTLVDGRILKEVYEDVVIEYNAPETIAYDDLGTFTWKNGGRVLSEDIIINLPVVLNYKWGTMRVEIPVTVYQTIGQ